jgi:hypothetical protein
VNVCFYLDSRYRDLWAHLVQTYALDLAYEVGCPEEDVTDSWICVSSPDDVPGTRVFFSPLNAKHSPGTVLLADAVIPADATLVFGLDDVHNQFTLREGEQVVYIDVPSNSVALHAAQAAVLVLHHLWSS